jgi:cyclin-dependent kinase 10
MDISESLPALRLIRAIRRHSMYDNFRKLDAGSFAYVLEATNLRTRMPVALKVYKPVTNFPKCLEHWVLRELRALTTLSHPNIVHLQEAVLIDNTSMVLQFKRYDCSLAQLFRLGGRLPDSVMKWVFREICKGVAAAHEAGIMHRDLKPGNILLMTMGEPEVVVADWGMARDVSDASADMLTADVITTWYAPPEILACRRTYGTSADVWSLGIMLLELHLGQYAYKVHDRPRFMQHMLGLVGVQTEEDCKFIAGCTGVEQRPLVGRISAYIASLQENDTDAPHFADLLQGMLSLQPHRRLSVKEILAHPFFSDTDSLRPLLPVYHSSSRSVLMGAPFEFGLPVVRIPRQVSPPVIPFQCGWPAAFLVGNHFTLVQLVSTKYAYWLQPLLLAMHMAWGVAAAGHRYFVHMFACFTLAAGSVAHVDNHKYREMATTPYINDSHIANATDLAVVEGQLLQELHGRVPQMPIEYLPFLELPRAMHVTAALLLGSSEFVLSQGFTVADIFTYCSTDTVPDILKDWLDLKLAPVL